MIRRFPRRLALFRALSTGIPKTRYEAQDATPGSRPVTPLPQASSIPQIDGSSPVPPQTSFTIPSQTSSPRQRAIVSIMRQVPNSLTIILSEPLIRSHSSLSPQDSESDAMAVLPHKPTGLLVSSFNTVTINPTPFVSFNIKLPSRTHSAILASGSFTASGINSAELAQKFLLPSGPKKSHVIKACTFTTEEEGPWLKSGQGGVWWMRCNWVREKSVRVGDHAIMVGEVMSAGKYDKRDERKSLFYLNGAYRECVTCDPGRTDKDPSTERENRGSQRLERVQIEDPVPSEEVEPSKGSLKIFRAHT